jgi:hypothetical protein
MPRPVALVERGMEAQQAIRETRHKCAPLWLAALQSGDAEAVTLAQCLATTLWVAGVQARKLTGHAARLIEEVA